MHPGAGFSLSPSAKDFVGHLGAQAGTAVWRQSWAYVFGNRSSIALKKMSISSKAEVFLDQWTR